MQQPIVEIGDRLVGAGQPVFVVAEIRDQPQWFSGPCQEVDRRSHSGRLRRSQVPEADSGKMRAHRSTVQRKGHALGSNDLY